jgi:small subunit ribosomal protein S16
VPVRIRMKRMGRKNRPFYRVVVVDGRKARDGRVIEYLGLYDPTVADTDARALLKSDRIDYWISVGALPSDNMRVLIKKYGTNGTHLEKQKAALAGIKSRQPYTPPAPVSRPKRKGEEPESQAAAAAQEAEAQESGATEETREPAAQES